jgi:tripartite-type tricarboxylate transporter receptor subunit TctC
MKHLACAAAAAALLGFPAAAMAEWVPDRPINLVVPWAAGGSTDQVTRLAAPILEEALGQPVVVVNQPGASGATGTQEVLASPRDGYTWTANAIANNGIYAISGLIPGTSLDDYRVYTSIANVAVVGVNADSPYQDFGELLEAMKSERITVATAGINSSGGKAFLNLEVAAGGELAAEMIAYEGGAPAVLAAAGGEAVVTTQLASEQVEMIRAGRIRPLAAMSAQPLVIEGMDPIPPITNWLTEMQPALDYFGILIPAGAPQEVYDTVDRIWADQVAASEDFQRYALQAGAVFDPAFGDAALAQVMPVVISEACGRAARGEAEADPSTIGVDCDTMTAN